MELQLVLVLWVSALVVDSSFGLTCGSNEILLNSPPTCESTCYRGCVTIPTGVPQMTCVCMPNYVRHDGQCIPQTSCPEISSSRDVTFDLFQQPQAANTIPRYDGQSTPQISCPGIRSSRDADNAPCYAILEPLVDTSIPNTAPCYAMAQLVDSNSVDTSIPCQSSCAPDSGADSTAISTPQSGPCSSLCIDQCALQSDCKTSGNFKQNTSQPQDSSSTLPSF